MNQIGNNPKPRTISCATCNFFQPCLEARQKGIGECRRNAPMPQPGPGRGMMILPVWPLLAETEWCGQYVRRETEQEPIPHPPEHGET